MSSTSNGFLFKNCYGYCSVFGNNLQGSSHRLKAVGGAYDKRKDLFMKACTKDKDYPIYDICANWVFKHCYRMLE